MRRGEKKLGRPADNEILRPCLKIVTFKIDNEVEVALEKLRASVGASVRGWRSVLLRRLVLEAAAQLQNREKREASE